MSLHQIEIFVIVGGMLTLFMWDRLRYDVVASLALLAAVITGCLSTEKAFSGFSNPVIIIIASVLVVSRAIGASGVLDGIMRRILRTTKSASAQIGLMVAAVTFLSAFMKNVGALGLFLPIALHTASRNGRSPSIYLMPLAFGSLIGGTITQIGTSPNLLISSVRADLAGAPFQMFDFTPVGLPLSILAVAFLAIGWRLLPRARRGQRSPDQAFEIESYTTDLRVPPESIAIGMTIGELEDLADGAVSVTALVRSNGRRFVPSADWMIQSGDLLNARVGATEVKKIADAAGLELVHAKDLAPPERASDELDTVEAVIMPGSLLIGRTVQSLNLRRRFETSILAVSRGGQAVSFGLDEHVFRAGDVIVLQSWEQKLPDVIAEFGCLPLAHRGLNLARRGTRWIPTIALVLAMVLVITHVLTVEIAFFGAAVSMIVLKQLTPKQAYDSIEWPIIVMLGTLIPVGEALKETGAADQVAQLLTHVAAQVPATVALGLVMLAAMLLSPLLHHAAAVLVMGPIAASTAQSLGYHTDPFLMAVALGASCDFLTPIGHQNNTLVMGPGGYRFGDYWRLGLPLSLLVLFLGTPLIAWYWPLG